MAAVRITSGPLRGVELETSLGVRRGRALRLLVRALRRRLGAGTTDAARASVTQGPAAP